MKILVVEDNPILRENLVFLLKKYHYVSECVWDGQQAINRIAHSKYDLVLLDINMPVMTGKQFLKKIRSSWNTLPVIALTSDNFLDDKIEMFDLWVDDYVTKPFDIEELVVRIKAILKRWSVIQDDTDTLWEISINYNSKKVLLNNDVLDLSHKQYLILELLIKNKWYPQNKNKIMEYVWWEQEDNLNLSSTTLESHIYSLRKLLWSNAIKTMKWVWYIME